MKVRRTSAKRLIRRSWTMMTALAGLTLFLTACTDSRIYDRYEHTTVGGWEKNDALTFDVSPLEKSGRYTVSLGVRTSDAYPFKNLNLVVEQTSFPSNKRTADVVNCRITDRKGTMLGNGITLYQYSIPVRKKFHMRGDSLHITVRHNMKREILPGIVDIGIRIDRD